MFSGVAFVSVASVGVVFLGIFVFGLFKVGDAVRVMFARVVVASGLRSDATSCSFSCDLDPLAVVCLLVCTILPEGLVVHDVGDHARRLLGANLRRE
jgi:hypothetical protein